MNKKIIITGSSGFVGSNFTKMSHDFDIHEVDLLCKKTKDINFNKVDSIVHLAAFVHQMHKVPSEKYFKINRDLTYEVAKKAKAEGVKQFIFMSTAKVYGESTTGKNALNEFSPCNPLDPYGQSKFEAESLLRSLENSNFKVAIIRSPLVYGPGVGGNLLSLIKLIDKYPILPFGDIKNKRSMVFVGNLIRLITHIINTSASGTYLAGDGESVSTTDLIKMITKYLNKKKYVFRIPSFFLDLLNKVQPSIFDRIWGSLELECKTSFQKLNFIPPYSFEEGIRETIYWYYNK